MRSLELERKDGIVHIVFGSLLKEGYIEKSISVHFSESDYEVFKVFINHHRLGSLVWESTEGKREMRRWESEEEAKEGSYLNMRYPQALADGPVSDDTYELALVYSVLDAVNSSPEIDPKWKSILGDLLMNVRKNALRIKLTS